MPQYRQESLLLRALLATGIASLCCAAALYLVLRTESAFLLAEGGVLLCGALLGIGPGLLALAIGAGATWYFIVPPTFDWGLAHERESWELLAYLALGLGLLGLMRLVSRQFPASSGRANHRPESTTTRLPQARLR